MYKIGARLTILLSIVTFFLLTNVSYAEGLSLTAKKGVLNLREYNGKSLNLDGEWEFYWNELIEPEQFTSLKKEVTYVTVPHQWGKEKNIEQIEPRGYGTYRLKIQIPDEDKGKIKAISLPNIASNYRLWIDGVLKEEIGQVGMTKETSIPMNSYKIITFIPTDNEIEIVLQVSNFSQRKAGIWTKIEYGNDYDLIQNRSVYFFISGTLIGSLLLIGSYHLVMFFNRKKNC